MDVEEKNGTAIIEYYESAISAMHKGAEVQTDVRIRQRGSKEERRLVRKQDLLILPLLSGSIFFAYLVCEKLRGTHDFSMKI